MTDISNKSPFSSISLEKLNGTSYTSIFTKKLNELNKPQKPLTLIFLIKKDSILLAMKKRGFGVGRWNGFGGKIEKQDESVLAGALRELEEESNVKNLPPTSSISPNTEDLSLNCLGRIFFNFGSHLDPNLFVVWTFYRFITEENESMIDEQLQETEEMLPKWFKFDEIPFDTMWPDDKIWLPILLKKVQDKNWKDGFEAYFDFPNSFDTFEEHQVNVISDGEAYFQKEIQAFKDGRMF